MASSIPAAKAKVLELLRARPALAAIQVEWAYQKDPAREAVFLGDAFIEEKAAALGTTRPREESYALDVIVSVKHEGNDAEGAERRMWQLVAEVEDALHDSPALGNAGGIYQAVIEGKAVQTFPADQSRVADCAIGIRIHARI